MRIEAALSDGTILPGMASRFHARCFCQRPSSLGTQCGSRGVDHDRPKKEPSASRNQIRKHQGVNQPEATIE